MLRNGWRLALLSCAGVLAGSLASNLARADDWPQFLGPTRNGISQETSLLDSWPANGPKVVWRVTGGVGMSGIAVSRGRAITLVRQDGQQTAVALDARTGKTIWKTALAPAYRNMMGDGARATPAVAGDKVFVFTGEGILACLNWSDGKVQWKANVVDLLQGKVADYGMASSPLVVDDRVIVTVGAPLGTVAAWDTANGKLAWKAGNDSAGYSSPAVLQLGGQQQLVTFTGDSVMGTSLDNGQVLWRYPFVTDYQCNIATPISVDGNLFVSAGENHGSAMLRIAERSGVFKVNEVWTSFGTKSVLRNEWQTSILINGMLYGLDNVGSAGPVTHLTCIRAADGKRIWQKTRFGKSNLIAADGKLFGSTYKGELVVVRVDPKKYQEIGRMQLLGKTRQAPSLSNGMLYFRDDREIVCVDVRKR